jgi:hypothetical protein
LFGGGENLAIKEMPLEEKYEKTLDAYLLNSATLYALHKKLGIVDKCIESLVKTQKNMIPSLPAATYKLFKTLAPGTAFNQLMDQYIYGMQASMPLSNIEVNRVSGREVTMRVKDCPLLKRNRELIKEAGLDVAPRELCEIEPKVMNGMAKDFGVEVSWRSEENGCLWTVRLK